MSFAEKWQLDEDKLTFIILSATNPANAGESSPAAAAVLEELFLPTTLLGLLPTDERLANLQMIGDVNIFLNGVIPLLDHQPPLAAPAPLFTTTGSQNSMFFSSDGNGESTRFPLKIVKRMWMTMIMIMISKPK